jgi:hypothetical protein
VDGVVRSVPVTVDYVIEAEPEAFALPDDQWAVLDPQGLALEPGQLVMVNATRSVLDGERVEPVLPRAAQVGVAAGGVPASGTEAVP